MGKLNIAHHKSYHPYRLDNIERVRKDEEQAKLKEEGEEGRIRVADSEARLDLLRGRAGGSKRVKNKDGEDTQSQALPALTSISTSSGHINLFADFEQHATSNALIRTRELTTKGAKPEDEKGVRLAPSAKDLKPWYVNSESQTEEMPEDKRMKDLSSKSTFDPLTSIKSQLSRSHPPTSLTQNQSSSFAQRRTQTQTPSNPTDARLQRESSERTRAMELIRRKKRERERASLGMGNMTPSTVGGDELDRSAGYGDVYNRKETEDAQRRRERERERDRGWGREYRWERRGSEYRDRRW